MPVSFKGGKVQHDPSVFLILDGSNWNGSTGVALKEQLLSLYGHLRNSSWQGILGQYYDDLGYVTQDAGVASTLIDTRVSAPTSFNNTKIEEEVAYAIAQAKWAREPNAQFVVVPAPGTTYESGFDTGFCGYHSIDSSGSSYTFVAYMGNEPFYKGCIGYDASGNADNVSSMVASHEYAESATDPDPGTGWTDSEGYEIADICASGDNQLSNGSWVQGLWSNSAEACVLEDNHEYFPKKEDAPAAVFGSEGNLYVTSEGLSNPLYATVREASGTWLTSSVVSGPLTMYSAPSEAFDSHGNLFVTAEGYGNRLYMWERYASNGSWYGPEAVSGEQTAYSAPSEAFDSKGNLFVTAEGYNHRLYMWERYASNGSWYGPEVVSGEQTAYSAPSEMFDSKGNLFVTAEGYNHKFYMWERYASNSSWYGPEVVSGEQTAYSAPSEAFDSKGNLLVTGEGYANRFYMWERYASNGSWYGPEIVSGAQTAYSAPSEAFDSKGNLFAVAEGYNNKLASWERYSSNGSWTGPLILSAEGVAN